MNSEGPTRHAIVSVSDAETVVSEKSKIEGVVVKPLLNEGMGADQYWMVHSEFPPGSGHRPHRHPNRDQAIYVLSGSLLYTDSDGGTHRLGAGDVVHVPAGEWHALDNDGDESALTLGLHGGTGSAQGGGYELRADVSS